LKRSKETPTRSHAPAELSTGKQAEEARQQGNEKTRERPLPLTVQRDKAINCDKLRGITIISNGGNWNKINSTNESVQ
jgi:hypothetical protein